VADTNTQIFLVCDKGRIEARSLTVGIGNDELLSTWREWRDCKRQSVRVFEGGCHIFPAERHSNAGLETTAANRDACAARAWAICGT